MTGNYRLPHGEDVLEYLERLVAAGRGVVPSLGHFTQAGALLAAGHARYASDLDGDALARTIEPTDEGRALAAVRAALREERRRAPPLPPAEAAAVLNPRPRLPRLAAPAAEED